MVPATSALRKRPRGQDKQAAFAGADCRRSAAPVFTGELGLAIPAWHALRPALAN
jgi:hypothetical protein